MKQSLIIKLATLRLAINHVLRNRQMTKAAFWPFSKPKPKYRFETDPNWQDDPEAVDEFLRQGDADLTTFVQDNMDGKWFPRKGPALKLREKNPDLEYMLANKYNLDLNNYTGEPFDLSGLGAVLPKKNIPLKPKEQQMLQDYIKARNVLEKEYGPAGEVIGPEQEKYYLNRGLRGLADIDDMINGYYSMDRGDDAFVGDDFYEKEKAIQNLVEKYREKFNRLPPDAIKVLRDFADLNNRYLDADPKADSFVKDVNRLSTKDIQEGGKDSLRDILLWLRFSNDYDALDYEKAMRRDPSYEGIKQKLFELGKKYNVEPLVPWEQ